VSNTLLKTLLSSCLSDGSMGSCQDAVVFLLLQGSLPCNQSATDRLLRYLRYVEDVVVRRILWIDLVLCHARTRVLVLRSICGRMLDHGSLSTAIKSLLRKIRSRTVRRTKLV
jgi:hypothetical protein